MSFKVSKRDGQERLKRE